MSKPATMEELIGQQVIGLSASGNKEFLAFDTVEGEMVAYQAEADCCSESWFADITGIGNLIGYIVRTVDEIELPGYNVEDGRGRQEEDEVYGFRIRSDGGTTDIVFRNSSNGYYGGSLNYYKGELPPMEPITGQEW